MAYLSIPNLYKEQDILLFKEAWSLEKVHGSSSHVSFHRERLDTPVSFFPGGEKMERFIQFFNREELLKGFHGLGVLGCVVFGEVYGGKCQGMSDTYGKERRFIAFDVKIDEHWLSVPQADEVVKSLGLEFVPYARITTDLAEIDKQRDLPSEVAIRRGMGNDKIREGIVLRPLIEVKKNNGERVIAKHKRDEFKETRTPRPLDGEKLAVLTAAKEVADEWATPMRLNHVLDKLGNPEGPEHIPIVIKAMLEDIRREGAGEFKDSKDVEKEIGKKTLHLYKATWKVNDGP